LKKEELIRRLRQLKMTLASGGVPQRLMVPAVEVAEFWLSHGFREVITRARMRVSGRSMPLAPSPSILSRRPIDPSVEFEIPAAQSPRSSIVIPVWNNPDITRDCLRAIAAETPAGSYEVIVIDNASELPTQEMLAGIKGLRIVRNEENIGFVGACNQGADTARGEFVVFLNNDTIVLSGWLDALVRTFERDASVGAAGAKLIYPNERLQEAGGIIWSDGEGWNYGNKEDPNRPEYNFVREVDYCSGACLMIRRQVFRDMGGFDSRYAPAYYEDTDLAFRLREQGLRVIYQPASRVVHREGATAGTDTSAGAKAYQIINHRKFKERHAGALAAQHPHDPSLLRRARDRRQGLRILLVDHMVPHHDQDSGSVRMMALLAMLVELGHRVTFLPDNLAGLEPYTTELQQMGIEVLYGPSEFGYVERFGHEFDCAILCRAHFAKSYLPGLRSAKPRPFIIFDTVDLHFLREQRRAELENDKRLAEAAEKTRLVETGVMRDSDMVWVTSTHEAELLRRDSSLPSVEVMPNIHSVRPHVPGYEQRRDMLFIGGFRHPPNEDAVLFFVNDIFPRVTKSLPEARFIIVGSHVPPSIERLSSDRVVVRGFVPNVEPVFDSCRLTVAPLRYGAGVKGKVTQSLAWGVPAVATPVAAEGLGLVDGQHLLVASDPETFARRIVQVYGDEALWTRLSHGGRTHIDEHLGYESVKQSLAAMLERV